MTKEEAKEALDRVIKISRALLYKPIQIAEILYKHRHHLIHDLSDLEQYRKASKHWRDQISQQLLGRVCTSSARFQDNLFEDNAIPPMVLVELGKQNVLSKGAVEAYIYSRFKAKQSMVTEIMNYLLQIKPNEFDVTKIIAFFNDTPGLKRSLDKVYEIIVYSLFITIIDALELTISLEINESKRDLLREFTDFTQKVMQIDLNNPFYNQKARVFRVGVTNAADRGLDMYSNWGPVIQIKHLTLDEELAENIVESVSSDRIIIVCHDAEKKILLSVLTQIGWKAKIQSIITEEMLVKWYDRALRGNYGEQLAKPLVDTFIEQMESEFPSVGGFPAILTERHYERINDDFWK